MRNLFMTGAAALALGAIPLGAAAQQVTKTTTTVTTPAQIEAEEATDSVPGSTNSIKDKRGSYEMTPEQTRVYETWSVDQRADYDVWPYDYQVYYWGLEPEYQTGYWALTPDQRAKIMAMADAQQAAAWASVMEQLGSTPDTATTATTFASTAMVQQVETKVPTEYPVCKGDVQDSCINPRAAGKNWGNRPLDHWPGKPASEIGG